MCGLGKVSHEVRERFDHEMARGVYSEQIPRDFYSSLISGISGAPTSSGLGRNPTPIVDQVQEVRQA